MLVMYLCPCVPRLRGCCSWGGPAAGRGRTWLPRPPPSRWDWLRVREVERGLATCRLEMLELLLISLLDTHNRLGRVTHRLHVCS